MAGSPYSRRNSGVAAAMGFDAEDLLQRLGLPRGAVPSLAGILPTSAAASPVPSFRRGPPFGGNFVSDPALAPGRRTTEAFGGAPSATDAEMADLRRQQAEFAKTTHDIDVRNSWFAVPALAPVATVLALEASGVLPAVRAASQVLRPHDFVERDPYLRVGDNWATRAGRRAHEDFKARVRAKPGWHADQGIETEQGMLRPDARAPERSYNPGKRFQLELKPNTPSGKKAAARAVRRYEEQTGNKTRAVFYDPKGFK